MIRRLAKIDPKSARLVAGQFVSMAALFVSMRLLTEWAPPAVFGQYALWLGAITLAKNAITIPVGQSIVKFNAELADACRPATRRALVFWWMPRTLAATAVAVALAKVMFPSLSLAAAVPAYALLVLWSCRDIEAAALNAELRHDLFTLNDCADVVFRQGGPVAAAYLLDADVPSLLSGAALGQLASLLFIWRTAGCCWKRPGLQQVAADAQIVATARRFMIPLLPTAFLGWVNGMSDRYLVAAIVGVDAAGLWSAAYPLASRPYLVVSRITNLLFRPRYMHASARGTPEAASTILRNWTYVVSALAVAGIGAYLLLSKVVVSVVLAREYAEVAGLLPWIAAGNAFLILDRVAEARLHAQNRTRTALVAHSAGAVTSVLSVCLLAKYYGLFGACVACPIYSAVKMLLMWLLATRQPIAAAGPCATMSRLNQASK